MLMLVYIKFDILFGYILVFFGFYERMVVKVFKDVSCTILLKYENLICASFAAGSRSFNKFAFGIGY